MFSGAAGWTIGNVCEGKPRVDTRTSHQDLALCQSNPRMCRSNPRMCPSVLWQVFGSKQYVVVQIVYVGVKQAVVKVVEETVSR